MLIVRIVFKTSIEKETDIGKIFHSLILRIP